MSGKPNREIFVKVDDRGSGASRVTTHRHIASVIGATRYVRADLADAQRKALVGLFKAYGAMCSLDVTPSARKVLMAQRYTDAWDKALEALAKGEQG